MACRTETKQIGNNEYSATQWPAEKSLLMKFRLTKVFGASLSSLLGVVDFKSMSVEDSKLEVALSSAINSLFSSATPEEAVSLIKECIVGTAIGDTRITDTKFNEVFSGDDMMDMYKVFFFVLKVNYGNLFKGQKVGDFLAKVKVPQ